LTAVSFLTGWCLRRDASADAASAVEFRRRCQRPKNDGLRQFCVRLDFFFTGAARKGKSRLGCTMAEGLLSSMPHARNLTAATFKTDGRQFSILTAAIFFDGRQFQNRRPSVLKNDGRQKVDGRHFSKLTAVKPKPK